MIEIRDYIFSKLNKIDCHVNKYGRNGLTNYSDFSSGSIIFVENGIGKNAVDFLPYFKKIKKDKSVFDNNIISYVGKDVNETIKIYKEFNPKIIGEVKCLKHYKDLNDGKEYTYENYEIALCDEIKHLPIFIHYDLIYDDAKLKEIIEFNPNRKVVLCHCGINEIDDPKIAFEKAIYLQHKYNNLWLEISWKALDYIGCDSMRLGKIDTDRLLLGTDFTVCDPIEKIEKRLKTFNYWYTKINLSRNITNLLK